MSNTTKSLYARTFLDEKGKLAIGAKPNLPLIVWLVFVAVGWVTSGAVDRVAGVIGHGALFTWAWLELFQGVNYFRRALGVVVLTYTILSALHQ